MTTNGSCLILDIIFVGIWLAGHKSVHLVADTRNSSNEKRYPFGESASVFQKLKMCHNVSIILGIFGTEYEALGTKYQRAYIHTYEGN